MASAGLSVFTYSIANFPTLRCLEQIRNDVCYHRLPVKVVAVGGGLAYGALGYTHHAVQDFALFRTLPSMTIAAPGDPMEVRACLRWLVANPRPSYLRLGKAGEPVFHPGVPEVEPGRWLQVAAGDRAGGETLLATGATLGIAMERQHAAAGERPAVQSLPLWSMASKAAQPAQVARHARVTTLEDHLRDGGFGSWLMEAVSDTPRTPRPTEGRGAGPSRLWHGRLAGDAQRLGRPEGVMARAAAIAPRRAAAPGASR